MLYCIRIGTTTAIDISMNKQNANKKVEVKWDNGYGLVVVIGTTKDKKNYGKVIVK